MYGIQQQQQDRQMMNIKSWCWRQKRPSFGSVVLVIIVVLVMSTSKNQHELLYFTTPSSTSFYSSKLVETSYGGNTYLLSSTQRHYLEQQEQQQQEQQQLQSSSSSESNPPSFSLYETRFVFVLGLEGTGHHLLRSLTEVSPLYQLITQNGNNNNIHPKYTHKIMQSIFRGETFPNNGIVSNSCARGTAAAGGGRGGGGGSFGGGGRNGIFKTTTTSTAGMTINLPTMNITKLVEKYQDVLTETHNEIYDKLILRRPGTNEISKNNKQVMYYPVNVLKLTSGDYGMLSYPNWGGPCRTLNYPNIDLLLKACNEKKKKNTHNTYYSCQIVYLYRHPYNVLTSTTINRPYNVYMIEAIHLYTTQLHILYSQLSTVPPGTTIGCWNLYDNDNSDNNTSTSSSISSGAYNDWKETMGPILGWYNDDDETDDISSSSSSATSTTTTTTYRVTDPSGTTSSSSSLQEAYDKVYREPKPIPSEFYKKIKPYQPYMDSMIRIHNQVIQLCHDQVSWTKQHNQK